MIYLMRHGADDPERLGGWSDSSLTQKGVRQVNGAVEKLVGKGIEAVYSSDLPRAAETARIVAGRLRLPVTYLPRFRETNNGLLAGMPRAEAKVKYPGVFWSALDWESAYPGGESPKEFFARIESAWSEFKSETRGKTVLLVSHGGVMNAILCIENGLRFTNKETRFRISDAGVISIKRRDF